MPHRLPGRAETAAAMHAHAALVAQLRRPQAYAHAVGEVGLIETPISSLLLAGDYVYKLKKPVAFGFVDFSTIEARREACDDELRLNRRTAPRWYLAVLPVCHGADGPSFDGGGPVVDWAVQMRRFDDRQRFDRLARHGQLQPRHIDRLAEVVARFHAGLPPAPPGYGRSEVARHWARENIAELAGLLTDRAAAAALAALQRWTEARGAQLAALIDLRRTTGHVREGHGDLHLGNIVWIDDAPVLFDALEFNDVLRHLDTIGDLAFTFMDLHAQGLPRLAWRFISAVLEASGDYDALPLLAWHAVYRALVRVKVALLEAPPGRAAAARYLRLATDLAGLGAAHPAPRLLLTGGVSGAGKSTVAALLAERLGALRVRSDTERKRLHGVPPTARTAPGIDLYSSAATRRTYERLRELAALALDAGESIVVDAAFLRRAERDAMRALAQQHKAGFQIVWCRAPDAVLRERVQQRLARNADPSDATLEVLTLQQRVADWPADDEAAHLVTLDTDVPLDALASRCDALAQADPDRCTPASA